jgi:hypothetical protein
VKQLTGQAIRLSVPLGFLEAQPTLDEEEYAALVASNRERFCGTLADIPLMIPQTQVKAPERPPVERETIRELEIRTRPVEPEITREPEIRTRPVTPPPPVETGIEEDRTAPRPRRAEYPVVEERELGKGGRQHKYLQSLAKELAEQGGLKATIEAPLPTGAGQVDVLLERDGVLAAIEISVTTPVEHERENLRKCLANAFPRIAVVLAKSKKTESSYRAALSEIVPAADRERVSFLSPEELPGFIAALTSPPEGTERIVRGYKVKGSFTQASAADTTARQEALAKLIVKSLKA